MNLSAFKIGFVALAVAGIGFAFIELRSPSGIPGLIEKRRQVHELEDTNLKLEREIEQKKQRIQRLQDNPADQELEIRQKLKLSRPGEKIYILDQKK